MARLQILELPEGPDDGRPPFILVVDQYQPLRCVEVTADGHPQIGSIDEFTGVAEQIGARAVVTFRETIEIPANDTTAYLDTSGHEEQDPVDYGQLVDIVHRALGIVAGSGPADIAGWLRTACRELEKSEAARAQLRDERAEARQWARHGYEIGQRHCGWSDHGVAPAWLTEGWPPHFDSCEHLKQMVEFDEALTRVRNLPTEPELMDARQEHPSVWRHGYHCGVLAAKAATRPSNEAARAAGDGG